MTGLERSQNKQTNKQTSAYVRKELEAELAGLEDAQEDRVALQGGRIWCVVV